MRRLPMSRLLILVSLMFVASAAAVPLGAQSSGLAPDLNLTFEEFTLDNGLHVIVHEDRKAPVVAVSIWYRVGSKNEPPSAWRFPPVTTSAPAPTASLRCSSSLAIAASSISGPICTPSSNPFTARPVDPAPWRHVSRCHAPVTDCAL